MRRDLSEMLGALAATQSRAVRLAIVKGVESLFDAVCATPEAITAVSDTNGSPPETVTAKLFVEPTETELRVMEARLPNGIEVNA
jgi:hypothetical protein